MCIVFYIIHSNLYKWRRRQISIPRPADRLAVKNLKINLKKEESLLRFTCYDLQTGTTWKWQFNAQVRGLLKTSFSINFKFVFFYEMYEESSTIQNYLLEIKLFVMGLCDESDLRNIMLVCMISVLSKIFLWYFFNPSHMSRV